MSVRRILVGLQWLSASAMAIFGGAAQAGSELAGAEEEFLRKLFAGQAVEADFAPAFLQAVPFAQVRALAETEGARIGRVRQITRQGGSFEVLSDTHRMSVQVALDASGRAVGLLLDPAEPLFVDAATVDTMLRALGDQVSWLALVDGKVVASHQADAALAVGSAFKLGILQVLRQDVARGLRSWSDVVTVEKRHKSLPTGDMRLLPDGSPVTLHTAAALMIADSDNTGTDLLIDTLGRDRIAQALDLTEVLTTREFFGLKANADLRAAWIQSSGPARQAIADQAAQELPRVDRIGHHDQGVEWYIPATKLCQIIQAMADEPILQINPGVLSGDWETLGYKGGSEEGVLNFTTVATRQGRTACFVLTVNAGSSVDAVAATSAYSALARLAMDAE